jgi:excisionase family DNA binding protein
VTRPLPPATCPTCGRAFARPPAPEGRRPTWLTVEDVARTLGVSKMTVYRLIHADELRAVRIGHVLRVDKHDLDGFLADATVVPE